MTQTEQKSILPTVFLVIGAVLWGVLTFSDFSTLRLVTFLGLSTAAVLSAPSKRQAGKR